MTTSHDPNLNVTISLDSLPGAPADLRTPLLAVPLATNSLDGDRVRAYTEAADVDDDLAASYISATTAAQVKAALAQSQRPAPPLVKVGYVDLVNSETYVSAIPLIRAADDNWYAYAVQDRTGVVAEAVSTAIQATRKIFAFQSSDATWLTAGLPTDYVDVAGHERTIGFYHDVDTAAYDLAALGAGLQDPDSFSAPWTMNVGGVAQYSTALTAGQRLAAIGNNINVLGQFGPSLAWNDPGTNIAGRTMRAIIARDWLQDRIEQRLFTYIANRSNQLSPIGVDGEGQAAIGGVVKQVLDEGVAIGHLTGGSGDKVTKVTYPTITATDVAQRRIRVQGQAYYVVDARLFEIPIFMEAFV